MKHYSLNLYWGCHLLYLGRCISLCMLLFRSCTEMMFFSSITAVCSCTIYLYHALKLILQSCLRVHCNHMVFIVSFCIIAICCIPSYINYCLHLGHIDLLLNHCHLLLYNGCQLMLQGFLIMHLIKCSDSNSASSSHAVVIWTCNMESSFALIPLAAGWKHFLVVCHDVVTAWAKADPQSHFLKSLAPWHSICDCICTLSIYSCTMTASSCFISFSSYPEIVWCVSWSNSQNALVGIHVPF